MNCNYCGKKVDGNEKFCTGCGAAISRESEEANTQSGQERNAVPPSPPQPPVPDETGRKINHGCLIAIGVPLAISVFLSLIVFKYMEGQFLINVIFLFIMTAPISFIIYLIVTLISKWMHRR